MIVSVDYALEVEKVEIGIAVNPFDLLDGRDLIQKEFNTGAKDFQHAYHHLSRKLQQATYFC